MTKDLAISVAGTMKVSRDSYLTTEDFINKVADNLRVNLKKIEENSNDQA